MNRKYTTAEEIARRTWFLLKLSRRPGVRLGEETLTDFLVINLLLSPNNAVRVLPVMKPEEANNGADLIVCVHRGDGWAHEYVVQAKKLYPNSRFGQYNGLNKKSGKSKRPQIDILEEYAEKSNAVPLYLLYNYVNDPLKRCHPCWHCCRKDADEKQFGCTLTPSWHIRDVIESRDKHQNFCDVHLKDATLPWRCTFPWRCAFDCPQGKNWKRIRKKFAKSYKSHAGTKPEIDFKGGLKKWPGDLWGAMVPFEPSQDDIMRIGDEKFVPRWLMLVDPYRD